MSFLVCFRCEGIAGTEQLIGHAYWGLADERLPSGTGEGVSTAPATG
jgi:hypothetical protein